MTNKTFPKFIKEGLTQRKIKWYLSLIEEGYSQGQIAEFEGITPQLLNIKINTFEGVYIQPPIKGTKPRRVEMTPTDEQTNVT